MKKIVSILAIVFLASILGFLGWRFNNQAEQPLPTTPRPRPFDVYSIDNLSKYHPQASSIKIERVLRQDDNFTSYLFSFNFNPNPASSQKKKVSGLINLPAGSQASQNQKFPAVVMLRGYVDQKIYQTGDGTRRAGEYFAKNGFITVAPDFLGYGQSDSEAGNIFETRFQTYTTVLALLSSLNSLNLWNKSDIFIWGHSNGGQIALTILEITGADYPTALWAPVSKPFPYSILYYTDESDDGGKLIRSELAEFEDVYDTDLYSIHKYYDRIKARVQLHQGTADDAVPKEWSDDLANTLLGLDLNLPAQAGLGYFTYPGADHNLNPAWYTVVERDLQFFKSHSKIDNQV